MKYNTFVVLDCKTRKILLVTSSARKALKLLEKGKKIEIWSDNELQDVVYIKYSFKMVEYVSFEKEFIKMKQLKAEARNRKRQEG